MPYAVELTGVVPQPAAATPPATALDPQLGASAKYAREDHTHAARIQRTSMSTAADGTITWTFARSIDCPAGAVPPVSYMVEDGGQPCIVSITGRTFTSAGGVDTHTGVTVKAQRSQTLPAVLTLLSGLISYNVFGSTNLLNIKINLWAAPPTQ